MEQLQIKLTFYYTDREPRTEIVSLWHGHYPFAFSDNKTLRHVVANNKVLHTQEEYDAFQHGINTVRNFLVSLVNI